MLEPYDMRRKVTADQKRCEKEMISLEPYFGLNKEVIDVAGIATCATTY